MPAEMFGWRKALGVAASSELGKVMLGRITHKWAIKAAEEAQRPEICPIMYGILQKSLTAVQDYNGRTFRPVTGTKAGDMAYLVGSGLPYAAKQEFEHKTKSHFVHKSIAKILPKFKAEVKATIIKAMALGFSTGI